MSVCVTVTLLDGLVLARSVYNTDMRFRSVCVLGTAHLVVSASGWAWTDISRPASAVAYLPAVTVRCNWLRAISSHSGANVTVARQLLHPALRLSRALPARWTFKSGMS